MTSRRDSLAKASPTADPRRAAGFRPDCFPLLDGLDLSSGGWPEGTPLLVVAFVLACYRLNEALQSPGRHSVRSAARRTREQTLRTRSHLARLESILARALRAGICVEAAWADRGVREVRSQYAGKRVDRGSDALQLRIRGLSRGTDTGSLAVPRGSFSPRLSRWLTRHSIATGTPETKVHSPRPPKPANPTP